MKECDRCHKIYDRIEPSPTGQFGGKRIEPKGWHAVGEYRRVRFAIVEYVCDRCKGTVKGIEPPPPGFVGSKRYTA